MFNYRRVARWLGAFVIFCSTSALAAPPDVVTVPWRGGLDLPHDIYNGKTIHLKGVAHGIAAGATASWDPGDGSGAIAVGPATGSDYDLSILHTYPASAPGTPFTATLEVCNGADCASDTYRLVTRVRTLDVEINIAIDEGLWYLHTQQVRNPGVWDDGRFVYSSGYSRDGETTASAVQAFQINNHFQTNPTGDDPYADTVRRGLDFMFSRIVSWPIAPQTMGNPDTNGNGIGASSGNNAVPLPTGLSSRPIYETGQMMDAIVTSKTPNEAVPTGGLAGLPSPSGAPAYTYFDAVQDMVDMYAWGQYDSGAGVPGSPAGGWRYSWNSHPDNSACQWAAIGILAARDLFGATVPAFLISENLNSWMRYSQNPSFPAAATGYGYTGRGEGRALSPSGLVQLVMDGVPKTDAARWVGVEDRLASLWNSWYRDTSDYYALFALAKAMRLALPSPVVIMGTGANAVDWFKADCANPAACNSSTDKWGVARTLIRDQFVDGRFNGWVGNRYASAWAVIILTGTLRLEPVAVAQANPNPGAAGVPVNFDGTSSFHQDPARTIINYEWDFDNDNITDATGATASNAFTCASLPCSFPVTLTVTDDGTPTPLVDRDTIVVDITNPPHPPTSDPNGPYLMCVNEPFTLDGSGSFDINEGTSLGGSPPFDTITAWDWELDFVQPLDFADAAGQTVGHAYASAGLRDIGLRVTDNSNASFGGGPDLTNDAFTTAVVTNCDCIGQITVRSKSTKNQLVWTPVAGAASYDIRRSTSGPHSGYSLIASGHVTSYATYLDSGLTDGVTYWYRVTPKDVSGAELCGSDDGSGTPQAGRRRR